MDGGCVVDKTKIMLSQLQTEVCIKLAEPVWIEENAQDLGLFSSIKTVVWYNRYGHSVFCS